LKISRRAYSSRRKQLTGNSQIPNDCGAMVAISGAPSKAKYPSAARRNRHLTIRIATKTPGPRKPKFGQQSFVAAVAAPVGASSVIRQHAA
jgi:hypothetical protein